MTARGAIACLKTSASHIASSHVSVSWDNLWSESEAKRRCPRRGSKRLLLRYRQDVAHIRKWFLYQVRKLAHSVNISGPTFMRLSRKPEHDATKKEMHVLLAYFQVGLCDYHAVCVSPPLSTSECLNQSLWNSVCVYLMAPESIRTEYFIKPSHQSVCPYIYIYISPTMLGNGLVKTFTAAVNTEATIEEI
jgi:hypothetical protein